MMGWQLRWWWRARLTASLKTRNAGSIQTQSGARLVATASAAAAPSRSSRDASKVARSTVIEARRAVLRPAHAQTVHGEQRKKAVP